MKTKIWIICAAGVAVLLTGCHTFFSESSRSRRHTSSLVKYLYPNRAVPVDKPAIPVLTLPLRVGVAFVPEERSNRSAYDSPSVLSEQEKVKLLKEVSAEFRKYPFVKSIEVIPSAYLSEGGSFENLEQMRSMFGVDVIALVSYDQIQFTDENLLSLSYLTIVGAYVVQGEKNDTRTMLDAAVYDIASRKLLFRAPGLSAIKGSAAPINLAEELRADRAKGFQRASTNLVANVDAQLAEFRERVKTSPEEIKIVRSAGYTGAGALGLTEAAAALLLSVAAIAMRRGKQ
jgi:rhombotail lipoprotein